MAQASADTSQVLFGVPSWMQNMPRRRRARDYFANQDGGNHGVCVARAP